MGCAGGRTQLGAQHLLAVCPGFRLGDLLAAARAGLPLELHWRQWAFVNCLIKNADMGRESCAPYFAHALWLCHPGLAKLCPSPTAAPCPTHVVDELLDHPVPLTLVVLCSVLAVLHQADLVGEAQDDSQLLQQVDAVPLEAVVPKQGRVRFAEHDEGFLLGTDSTDPIMAQPGSRVSSPGCAGMGTSWE